MRLLDTSRGRSGCNSIFHTNSAGILILHILQILQKSGVRAEETAGTNCHSVDQTLSGWNSDPSASEQEIDGGKGDVTWGEQVRDW